MNCRYRGIALAYMSYRASGWWHLHWILLGQVQRFSELQLAFEQGWVLSSSEVDRLQDLASRMPQLMVRLLIDVTHMCTLLLVAE